MSREARVTIDGRELTPGQVLAVRVAIGAYAAELQEQGLGDDGHGRSMKAGYLGRLAEVEVMLIEGAGPHHSKAEEPPSVDGRPRVTRAETAEALLNFLEKSLEHGQEINIKPPEVFKTETATIQATCIAGSRFADWSTLIVKVEPLVR